MGNEVGQQREGSQARAVFMVLGIIVLLRCLEVFFYQNKILNFLDPSSSTNHTSPRTNGNYSAAATRIALPSLPLAEPPEISSAAAEQARNFVLARRNVYHQQGLEYRWKLRGIGYLYTAHKMVLLAQLPKSDSDDGRGVASVAGGRQSVTIHNVSNETTTITNCEKYTIWVRVDGPEIFAGAAQAVHSSDDNSCFWKFDFDLRQAGTYKVDAKLLLWNGDAQIFENQCQFTTGVPPNETLDRLKHDGFQGFKMYTPSLMCCEICSRTPHCVSWSSPFGRMDNPTPLRTGCELYFERDDAAADEYVPVSHLWPRRHQRRRLPAASQMHGTAHGHPTAYFLGCGWSYWFTLDFPCLSGDLDDRVFSVDSTFEAKMIPKDEEETDVTREQQQVSDTSSLPLCALADERFETVPQGRWVREPPSSTVKTCPPLNTVEALVKKFRITEFIDERPECWRRENLSIIGNQCMEMNCKLIRKDTLWKSSLHAETDFAGSWQPYSCRYQEFSTKQLQECATRRKIVSFQYKGMSIAEFMNDFVQYRLRNVTLYPDRNDPEATTVVFDSLELLRRAKEPDGLLEQELMTDLAVAAPDREEHYWISGFFLSSERDAHAHVRRMERFHRTLPPLLASKNYRTLNAFDPSAAFTYDSAAQNDGMHLIGPPMKAVVTKLFHHACAGVLSRGNRT